METIYNPNKLQFFTQSPYDDDLVRNSFQRQQDDNHFYRTNPTNTYLQYKKSPVKTMHPYQNLVSPKNNAKTPYFSSPYGRTNQNNFTTQKRQNYNIQNVNLQNQKKYFQMQTTISQLKISLHQSLDNQNKLQEQLHHQKTRNFQLFQLKRRLQEQLSKMQFQLDRINSCENLQQRQAIIKRQSVQTQNQSLSRKVNDLHQELKKIKRQHRDLMTQYNNSINNCQVQAKQNVLLLQKIDLLSDQINYIKTQMSHSQNNNLNKNVNFQMQKGHLQNINQITTTRTDQYDSSHANSPQKFGQIYHNLLRKDMKFYNSPPTTKPNSNAYNSYDKKYQDENSKLLQDYQQLLAQNQSMKKLCQEFYQNKDNKSTNFHQEKKMINEELSSSRMNMLKTYQKKNLQKQVNNLRETVIQQLLRKYYEKTLRYSKKKNRNCLIVFISQVSKSIQILDKMVLNYLMARDILIKQTQGQQKQFSKDDSQSTQFHELTIKVKENLKNQLRKNKNKATKSQVLNLNINSYFLGLFRLLTLIYRSAEKSDSEINTYMKHLSLKYLHKIAEQRRKM